MNSINSSFNVCSAEIKRWLQREPGVQAETLTQWLLPELSRLNQNIHYKSKPAKEGSGSVDWQWWFVISDQLSFMANARAIKPGDEKILMTSMDNNDPGFYVLYSINDQNTAKCKNGKSLDGIFLTEANQLRELLNENNNASAPQILAISNPASCMVGCPGIYGEGMNKEEGFRWHVGNYYPMMSDGFRETPEEIIAFMESGMLSETLDADSMLVFDLREW